MSIYYQDEHVTIHHGDALEVRAVSGVEVTWVPVPVPRIVGTSTWCRECEAVVDEQEGTESCVPAGHLGHNLIVTLTHDDGSRISRRIKVATRPPVDNDVPAHANGEDWPAHEVTR